MLQSLTKITESKVYHINNIIFFTSHAERLTCTHYFIGPLQLEKPVENRRITKFGALALKNDSDFMAV